MNSDTPKTDAAWQGVSITSYLRTRLEHARAQERLVNELCEALTKLLHMTGDKPFAHQYIREALSKAK